MLWQEDGVSSVVGMTAKACIGNKRHSARQARQSMSHGPAGICLLVVLLLHTLLQMVVDVGAEHGWLPCCSGIAPLWSDQFKFDYIVGRGVSPGPTNCFLECRFSSNFIRNNVYRITRCTHGAVRGAAMVGLALGRLTGEGRVSALGLLTATHKTVQHIAANEQ